MMKLCFICIIFLSTANQILCQTTDGFVNIDCGNTKNYTDPITNFVYTTDDQYIDTGTNYNIRDNYKTKLDHNETDLNLRSFPNGDRNCYTLNSVVQNSVYLVRASFFYGNYDSLGSVKSNNPILFDLHIGVNYWRTVNISDPSVTFRHEAITVALADFLLVCLVNKGHGTPFINSLEMRPLKSSLYPYVSSSQFIDLDVRVDLGGNKITRYSDDKYDRIWSPHINLYTNISTSLKVRNDNDESTPPSSVLQTAILPPNPNDSSLYLFWSKPSNNPQILTNFHFAEIEQLPPGGIREFNIFYNENYEMPLYDHARPLYLQALTTYTPDPLPEPSSDRYLITLNATSNSTAPPLLNAVEVFSLLQVKNAMTDLTDVDAILEIKLEYKVNKSWSGDPCAPVNYTWAGVGCSSGRDSPKIISLNLSSSGLTGSLSSSFSKLQNIKILDLSNNRLNGTIPEFFSTMKSLQVLNLSCNSFKGSIPDALQNKVSAGQLTLRNDDACSFATSNNNNNNNYKKATIAVMVVVFVVMVLLSVSFCIICKRSSRITDNYKKLKNKILRLDHHMPTPEHPIVRLKTKKYTKQEIETITENFATKIAGGGFGGVFRGTLTDGTSVAVKKLSETSKQGLEQFAAEAESLAMLHHRNLVSLLGYCEDDKCVALVYEFMSMGSLEDHIKGNQDFERILGWRERLHVVLEAAQGLDYLHRGGTVPIVHRDVKSTNILLGSNLEAKVSDLGLARAFQSSTQTETETLVCGTHGYLDPEYFRNGILTKKSDVYSFGVVLLEIITGLSPIIKYPNGDVVNLIHYITDKVKQHDITMVADRRFQGNYDINSVWKVMELALSCTQETSPPRPTMADVVDQLTISMELENLRESRNESTYSSDRISKSNNTSLSNHSTERIRLNNASFPNSTEDASTEYDTCLENGSDMFPPAVR